MKSLSSLGALNRTIKSGVAKNNVQCAYNNMMNKNKSQILIFFLLVVFLLQLIPFAAGEEIVGDVQSEQNAGVQDKISAEDADEIEFNLNVVPVVFSQHIAPCSPVSFEVSVENTGNFDDVLSFSLAPFAGVDISPSETVLKPGETQTVLIRFIPDDCSVFGAFPLVFTAVSDVTGIVVELDLNLVIDAADVLAVGTGVDKIVAGNGLLTAQIPVKNKGVSDASYKMSVTGPDWVKFDINKLTVPAGGESSLTLIINPDESVEKKEYSVVLNAASSTSDRVYSKSILINLASPGIFSRLGRFVPKLFSVAKTGLSVVAAIIVLLVIVGVIRRFSKGKDAEDSGDGFVDDVVQKDEVKDETVQVIDERKVRRAVEKELRSKFVFVPKSSVFSPQFLWAKLLGRLFVVGLLVALVVVGYLKNNVLLDYLDYISLGVIIIGFVFLVKYVARKFRFVNYWKFLAAGDEVSLDTGWKKGLVKVSFSVVNAVENFKLQVVKGRRSVSVSAGENVYSYVSFGTNVTAAVVNDVSFVFKVKKAWLARFSSSEKDLKILGFVNNRWRALDSAVIGSDNKFIFVEAQSPVLVPVAVVGKSKSVVGKVEQAVVKEVIEKKTVSFRKKLSFGWVKNFVAYGVLFILLAGVFAAFAYLSQVEPLPPETKGIPPQVWSQDTVHSLDISGFFSDPDGDALSFSATSVENIKIEFDKSNVLFTPDNGWSGRRSVTFTAHDGEASVSSNEVVLIVKKQLIPAWLKPHIPQIISGVLFVIVVVLLIVFRDSIVKFLDEEKD